MEPLFTKMMITSIAIILMILLLSIESIIAFNFNLQVMERVNERLNDFMTMPIEIATRVAEYRRLGGFRSNIDASDRIDLTRYMYADRPILFYTGLEDGTFISYTNNFGAAFYRDPGEGGYDAKNVPADKETYLRSCIDPQNGTSKECRLMTNESYVSCINDCQLIPCKDEEAQVLCNTSSSSSSSSIYDDECYISTKVKLCKNYKIKTAGDNDALGFIPATFSCINSTGQPEQRPGLVIINTTTQSLGNCYYRDGITLVNRTLSGLYDDCQLSTISNEQKENQTSTTKLDICHDNFVGAYETINYDPRFRPWFIATKKEQSPIWTDPYVFFDVNDIGITYCQPIYVDDDNTGRQIFTGVIAVDYILNDVRDFLTNEYYGTEMTVFVVESKEPYYAMASSTGSPSTKFVLKTNSSQPCPYDEYPLNPSCDVVRISVNELKGHPMDTLIQRTFAAHKELNFPSNELVNVKEDDNVGSKAYVTQGSPYKQLTAKNLEWYIFVIMPMDRSTSDAAVRGETIFVVVCIVASLGFAGCLCLFILFFRKRHERAVIHSDWRFTCAFIFGCTLLNLSSFALLGPNTKASCMWRMWSFNAFFVVALSPLFVKVWRMYKLVSASSGFQRTTITNYLAFLYAMPLIIAELIILTIFSFVDRPLPVETFDSDNSNGLQTVTCEQQSSAFFITQFIFDGILVLVGCVLAYKTRDLDPRFGEAKQLGFSMYNVAFTGIVLVCIFQTVDLDQVSQIVLQSVGVLWGSFFCSFAFVLPRLLEVAKSTQKGRQASKIWMDNSKGHQILISNNELAESDDGSDDGVGYSVAKSRRRVKKASKTRMDTPTDQQILFPVQDTAESASVQYPSLTSPTSSTHPRTCDSKKHQGVVQISSEFSSNFDNKSDDCGSDDDAGFDYENSELKGLVMCQPETFLMGASTTDSFVVSSNKSYNDSGNRIEHGQADANSHNECVLVSQNGSTPPTVAHDSLGYSSRSRNCADQTEIQGKNKQNVSNKIDDILGVIAVSHSCLSSPVTNVTKEGNYLEKNLSSSSIVETVTFHFL